MKKTMMPLFFILVLLPLYTQTSHATPFYQGKVIKQLPPTPEADTIFTAA